MSLPDAQKLFEYGAYVVAICSVAHTFLPPWEMLNDFPSAQKYYKLVVYIIGYTAINGRSTIYKQISIQNPQGINYTNGGNNDVLKKTGPDTSQGGVSGGGGSGVKPGPPAGTPPGQ